MAKNYFFHIFINFLYCFSYFESKECHIDFQILPYSSRTSLWLNDSFQLICRTNDCWEPVYIIKQDSPITKDCKLQNNNNNPRYYWLSCYEQQKLITSINGKNIFRRTLKLIVNNTQWEDRGYWSCHSGDHFSIFHLNSIHNSGRLLPIQIFSVENINNEIYSIPLLKTNASFIKGTGSRSNPIDLRDNQINKSLILICQSTCANPSTELHWLATDQTQLVHYPNATPSSSTSFSNDAADVTWLQREEGFDDCQQQFPGMTVNKTKWFFNCSQISLFGSIQISCLATGPQYAFSKWESIHQSIHIICRDPPPSSNWFVLMWQRLSQVDIFLLTMCIAVAALIIFILLCSRFNKSSAYSIAKSSKNRQDYQNNNNSNNNHPPPSHHEDRYYHRNPTAPPPKPKSSNADFTYSDTCFV